MNTSKPLDGRRAVVPASREEMVRLRAPFFVGRPRIFLRRDVFLKAMFFGFLI